MASIRVYPIATRALAAFFTGFALAATAWGEEAVFARATGASMRLDTRAGVRIAAQGASETIAYSPRWGADGVRGVPALPGDESGVRSAPALPRVIANWKHWLTARYGIAFQVNFWDTRLRDEAHYAEKFRYVCNNPMRKGLCRAAREWPHVIAFDRQSGAERRGNEHR